MISVPAWRRPLLTALLLWLAYLPGPVSMGSRDNWPAVLITESILAGKGLDLGPYYASPLSREAYEVHEEQGRIYSNFPLVHAIPALPLAGVARAVFPRKEPLRRALYVGRAAGALSVAAALAISFEIALRCTSTTPALLLLLGAAFASPLFTVSSRELWTHGPAALALSGLAWMGATGRKSVGPGAGVLLAFLFFVRPAAAIPAIALLVASRGLPRKLTELPRAWWATSLAALAAVLSLIALDHVLGGPLIGYQRIHLRGASWRFPDLAVLAAYLVSPGRGLLLFAPVSLLAVAGAYRAWSREAGAGDAGVGPRVARGCTAAVAVALVEVSCFRHWWGGVSVGPRLLSEYVPLLVVLASLAPRSWILGGSFLFIPLGLFHGLQVYSGMPSWDHRRGIDHNPEAVWDFRDTPFSYVFAGPRRPDLQGMKPEALVLTPGEHPSGTNGENAWLVYGWEPPEPGGLWAAADAPWHLQESWLAFSLPGPGKYALTLNAAAPAPRGRNQRLIVEQPGANLSLSFSRGLWDYEELRIPLTYRPGLIVLKFHASHAWSPGSGDTRRCFFFLRALRLERTGDE